MQQVLPPGYHDQKALLEMRGKLVLDNDHDNGNRFIYDL